MANVNIQLGYKDSTWFANNATLVLLAGQVVYLQQTGTYKIGDGTTQLQNLAFKGVSAQTELVVATVVNNTGVNLLASNYQAVKVSTAQGQRLAVDFAQANNDNNSADTIGIVNQNINNNQEGTITILGQLSEINTTGSLQGETWVDGDVLYLSPTVAGQITKVKPNGLTGHMVVIGYVEYAHSQHGKIYIKIQNGYELEELHNTADVTYSTPIDADSLLIKDSTASLWKRLTWSNLKTLIFTIPSLVSQAAGVAITGVQWVLGSKQWIGGNITTQKEIELTSPSYSFTTPSTITEAYSMYVNAPTASTNATITNSYAIGANGGFITTIGTGKMSIVGFSGTQVAMYMNNTTATGPTNYALLTTNSTAIFNGRTNMSLAAGGTSYFSLSPAANTVMFNFSNAVRTGNTASLEVPYFKITGASTTWAAGTIANQRWNYLTANTASFNFSSTINESYGLFVEQAIAGTNATITNNYSLGTNGKAKFGGNIELTQTVTTETVTSDTTVTIKINGVNYKLLAKS